MLFKCLLVMLLECHIVFHSNYYGYHYPKTFSSTFFNLFSIKKYDLLLLVKKIMKLEKTKKGYLEKEDKS